MEKVKASEIAGKIGSKYGFDITTVLLIVDIIIKLYQLYDFCDVEPGLNTRKRAIKVSSRIVLGRKLYNKHGADIVDELSQYTLKELKNVDPS